MSKTITLIIGVLAIANVIYSFFGNSETVNMFGFDLNIWGYRLLWTLLAIGIFYDYLKKKKIS